MHGHYRFAGGRWFLGLIASLLLGITVSGWLVWSAAYATLRGLRLDVPDEYFAVGLTVVTCLLAVWATASSLHAFQVRSRAAVTAGVVLVGITTLVVGWKLRVWALQVGPLPVVQLTHGLNSIDIAAILASEPGEGTMLAGPLRYAVWALEALLISAAALALRDRALAAPQCPYCGAWCSRPKHLATLDIDDDDEIRYRLKRGDWVFFARLPRIDDNARTGLRLKLSKCRRCHNTRALSMVLTCDKWRRTVIVQHMLLGPDAWRTIAPLHTAAQTRNAPTARTSIRTASPRA